MLSCYRLACRQAGTIVLLLLFIIAAEATAADEWRTLSKGLEYKKISVNTMVGSERTASPGAIHLFKIDTTQYKLDVITAKRFNMLNSNAKTFAQKAAALIAINGGFFSPEFESLGLLVQKNKEINKIKWVGWWHIFQMRYMKPQIITKQEYTLIPDIEMAIEAGPRLLIDGQIVAKLKPSVAERSALGITADGKVIIAATDALPLSLNEFAGYLKAAGCYDALNLDGGSSTQIYAKIGEFELNRAGLGLVANGVGVFPR